VRVDSRADVVHPVEVATVDHSTRLEAPAEAVWAAVKTPAAFRRVTRHVISMPVIRGRVEPWREGETVTGWVFLFGFIPFSRHQLHVASIDDAARTLTSRERGGLLRRWDHAIIVEPIDDRSCTYRDTVTIEAGPFTPLVAAYAHWFYRVRQRRWRALARELAA